MEETLQLCLGGAVVSVDLHRESLLPLSVSHALVQASSAKAVLSLICFPGTVAGRREVVVSPRTARPSARRA